MPKVPIALAFVAGGLATVNPCGFALLPPILAVFVGQDHEGPVWHRTFRSMLVGLLVTAGFLAVFAAIGIPVTLGASRITSAIPWLGVGIGVVLASVGLLTVTGRKIYLPIRGPRASPSGQGLKAVFLYGIAYGVASLGCTLPVFLAVVGVSLANAGPGGIMITFGSWGAGMALVFMAVALGAGLMRDGVARALKRLLPRMDRITGGLLLIAGAYLSYYWGRVLFSPVGALAEDPLVRTVNQLIAATQQWATSGGGLWFVLAATTLVAIMAAFALFKASEGKAGRTDERMLSPGGQRPTDE